MAFDRENFFNSWRVDGHYTRGSMIADGFEALHAELAELKVACLVLKDRIAGIEGMVCDRPENAPDVPARETGWAVVGTAAYVNVVFTCSGFEARADRSRVLWLRSAYLASDLAAALGAGRPALLYKDTLEEVDA